MHEQNSSTHQYISSKHEQNSSTHTNLVRKNKSKKSIKQKSSAQIIRDIVFCTPKNSMCTPKCYLLYPIKI